MTQSDLSAAISAAYADPATNQKMLDRAAESFNQGDFLAAENALAAAEIPESDWETAKSGEFHY